MGMESPTLFHDSAKATKQDAKCTYEYVKEYILLQVSIRFRRSLLRNRECFYELTLKREHTIPFFSQNRKRWNMGICAKSHAC